MSKNAAFAIIGGVYLLWCVFLMAVAVYDQKHGSVKAKKSKYDERQLLDQGRAYKLAFLTTVLCDALYIVTKEGFGLVWCEDIFAFGLSAMLGVTVFTVFCLLHDAFFRVGEESVAGTLPAFICILCGGVTSMLSSSDLLERQELFRDGLIRGKALVIIFCLYFLLLAVTMGITTRRQKKVK